MKECCKIKEDPKWNFNKPCLQDHEHTEVYNNYTTTVKTTTPFNVPKFDNEVEIGLEDVVSVAPGAILWNLKVGGLTVKSYNAETKTVIATPANINVDFGSLVVAGTEFTIGIPNIGKDTKAEYLDSPYLAADFISPAPGSCQEASVTSVSGLGINNKVSVSGYVYRIGAIVNKSTLRLCNDGDGADGGVVIRFDPEDCGEPSVPLIVYETNPCEATPVSTGNIVVCKDNGLTTIQGEADGQILRWNNNHKRWDLVNAYIDENCTYLTTCFTVDTLDQAYVATVKNTAIFNVDNKVLIDDVKFVIDEIVDSTHLKLKPETTFAEITTYPVGTNVCLESCCAWVPKALQDTIYSDSWRPISLYNYIVNLVQTKSLSPAVLTSVTIAPDSQYPINAQDKSISIANITNTNSQYSLILNIRAHCFITGIVLEQANKMFFAEQQCNFTLVDSYIDSQGQTVPGTTPTTENINRSNLETLYVTTVHGAGKRAKSINYDYEFIYELDPYDKDNDKANTLTITLTHILKVLQASELSFSFGTGTNRAVFETQLIIQGSYNESIQP